METTYLSLGPRGRLQAQTGARAGVAVAPRAGQRADEAPQDQPIHLTPRQREVLSLLCAGLPNKLISRHLKIAGGTVKVHVASVLRALGASSRLEAVVLAARYGLDGEGAGGA